MELFVGLPNVMLLLYIYLFVITACVVFLFTVLTIKIKNEIKRRIIRGSDSENK